MTHITFLTGEYPPMQGGIADYTAHLARHLRGVGVAPAVLISRKYPGGPAEVEGVPVYPVLSGWGGRCWREIPRFLQTHPTDILHIQYQAAAFDLAGWVNGLPWYLRLRKSPVKIVTTFHDLRIPYLFPKAGPLRWQAILALARYSHVVICTNAEDAAVLRGYPWGNHVVEIPLGNNVAVNPPTGYNRQAWRQKLGLAENSLALAYFGFLNESKGGEDLIAALARLVEHGVDARLLLVGGEVGDSDPRNADYARRVRRLIEERGLASRIIVTGYVDLSEVSAHLLAADAAVLPYRDGVSFRRTTLLAVLAHGLPVITTFPRVAVPDVADGETMLLAAPQDVGGLADAVLRLTADPALRNRLAENGAQLAARFSWDQIAEKTLQVFKTCKV